MRANEAAEPRARYDKLVSVLAWQRSHVTPIDRLTRSWIRNPSDEKAAAAGCRFNASRGQHVLDFAARYLRLYEGDLAGQLLAPMPWQRDLCMRLFGWEKWSERLGRWIRRFTKASIWIPKKNGKSPTLAWLALYLLTADGEPGQKVYLCAKDGAQSKEIAGKHAIEMVRSSPELSAACQINKGSAQITHLASKSILKPLSSGDVTSQKSKEGLNGCVLVDETHVVDRAFMNRISRAGISRSEPMHLEVSTAGNDPDCYGKEQFDYGKRVEAGLQEDQSFFFMAYEAPQDLSDAELAADPVKYGKAANPAWGFTVNEEEYLDDYRRSTVSISKLADFKMYRLNVWQATVSLWLRVDDWARNKVDFTEAELVARECFGGLDLAKTRDMIAWVLIFPMFDIAEDLYRIMPRFFLPEETARLNNDKVPFLNWAHSGHLILTPGNSADYTFLKRQIVADAERFQLVDFGYDPWNADATTLELEEQHGLRRILFPQTIMNFAEPTREFERLVLAGRMQHNGHPVLSWQAQHCKVRSDANGNIRPVKPLNEDLKKIDGMVGGIMALARALEMAGKSSPTITYR